MAKRVLLIVAACLLFAGCTSDAESDLAGCEVEAMKSHVVDSLGPGFVRACMISKGFDVVYRPDINCIAILNFNGYSSGCFERRGIWRSIKQLTQKSS